ncbi:MAG: histidine phosphatase family protein [Ectothiorhodospiraceae bacterium]|nr:histidine phosphatase family protein [Chromatiales bacterium]MCP5154676.1 histidine phosphatase family protein [Ectothiorhodospiraceae bacterium]
MRIFLVRHGETDGNAERVVQVPETPLNPRGHEQARRVAARLRAVGLRHVLSSDYARAYLTAHAIHQASGAPLRVETLLRERHFGIHRGVRYSDLDVDLFAPDYAPPGGESVAMFDARVARAWAAVTAFATSVGEPVAVVSHAMVCRAMVEQHVERPDAEPIRWVNTAVAEIRPPERAGGRWSAVTVACSAHLDDTLIGRGQVAGI